MTTATTDDSHSPRHPLDGHSRVPHRQLRRVGRGLAGDASQPRAGGDYLDTFGTVDTAQVQSVVDAATDGGRLARRWWSAYTTCSTPWKRNSGWDRKVLGQSPATIDAALPRAARSRCVTSSPHRKAPTMNDRHELQEQTMTTATFRDRAAERVRLDSGIEALYL